MAIVTWSIGSALAKMSSDRLSELINFHGFVKVCRSNLLSEFQPSWLERMLLQARHILEATLSSSPLRQVLLYFETGTRRPG